MITRLLDHKNITREIHYISRAVDEPESSDSSARNSSVRGSARIIKRGIELLKIGSAKRAAPFGSIRYVNKTLDPQLICPNHMSDIIDPSSPVPNRLKHRSNSLKKRVKSNFIPMVRKNKPIEPIHL